jgi:hypothetical protein
MNDEKRFSASTLTQTLREGLILNRKIKSDGCLRDRTLRIYSISLADFLRGEGVEILGPCRSLFVHMFFSFVNRRRSNGCRGPPSIGTSAKHEASLEFGKADA